MSDERDIVEMMKDGSVHELATALQAERARIRELEKRLHLRDIALKAMSKKRAEAYDCGVREGMVLVRQQADAWLDGRERTMALSCYTAALAAYEKEVGRE